jgi:hypothetical protein
VKGNGIRITVLLLFMLFIVIYFAGCGDTELNSKWRTQNITIDGNDSDWSNSLVFYNEINSLVGVQNDRDYLYLCLVTSDQQLERKIFTTGITIWFDNTDKGDKKFGIRYPLMAKNMNRDAFENGDDQAEGRRTNPDDGRETPSDNRLAAGFPGRENTEDKFLKNQTEIEVIDANNESTRYPIAQLKGVQLKMTVKDYRMVYEFRIPIAMKNEYSYAVGAASGSTISVGLETGTQEAKRNKNFSDRGAGEGGDDPSQGSGDGMSGGDNYGGQGNGMHSGGRGRSHTGGQVKGASTQPLNFWADVKLSTGSN